MYELRLKHKCKYLKTDVFKIAQVNFFSPGEKLDISTFFNIMYQKFVANDGGASILDFKFSPASVIPGIRGYLRIRDIPGYRVLPDCITSEPISNLGHILTVKNPNEALLPLKVNIKL